MLDIPSKLRSEALKIWMFARSKATAEYASFFANSQFVGCMALAISEHFKNCFICYKQPPNSLSTLSPTSNAFIPIEKT